MEGTSILWCLMRCLDTDLAVGLLFRCEFQKSEKKISLHADAASVQGQIWILVRNNVSQALMSLISNLR